MVLRRVMSVFVPVTRSARPESSRSTTRPCTRNHTSSPEGVTILCSLVKRLASPLNAESHAFRTASRSSSGMRATRVVIDVSTGTRDCPISSDHRSER